MSLRTVAEDACTWGATEPEPTGWAVSMYSSTTARRIAALRSSSMGEPGMLLRQGPTRHPVHLRTLRVLGRTRVGGIATDCECRARPRAGGGVGDGDVGRRLRRPV